MQSGCPGPQRPGAQTLQRRHRAHLPVAERGSQRGRPGPAPESPLRGRPRLRAPRSGCAPPTPRPRIAPLPGPRAARAPRRPTTPFPGSPTAEPAADSRVGGSPAQRRPRSASPATHRRREGAARGAGWRPRSSSLSPRPDPLLGADGASAPVSTRPLSGPNPRQALPGERGEGRGLAPELLPGWSCQPSREGRGLRARRQRTRPRGPAPGLLANPCGPAGPGLPLAPLILTPVRIAPFQPLNSTEARRV